MHILIDTNIIIPLEPSGLTDFGINTDSALQFHSLVQRSGSVIFIHPAIENDFERDHNKERAHLRKTIIRRYNLIDSPPDVSILNERDVGSPVIGSNDYVDNCFLASLQGNAVDLFVTEDNGIHKKAKKIGLSSRVLYLNEAIGLLSDFFDEVPPPPPSVVMKKAYELNEKDPIFDSLRNDYAPTFDSWLEKCKRKHRDCYVIYEKGKFNIAGLCILKKEDALPTGKNGKILKLCTFKVAETQHGNRYGELLLKSVFDYADSNNYEYLYFTTFPKHDELIEFASSFGFRCIERPGENEVIMEKTLTFSQSDIDTLSPLDFHIRYGPRVTLFSTNSTFVIPIKPEFHDILFPEAREQLLLFPDLRPCGNSIKKAYLSNSATKQIRPGDNLLFYRSQLKPSVTALGIIEDFKRSSDPNEIARYVGSRTVYKFSEIAQMCQKAKRETLAIKFRYVKAVNPEISLSDLKQHHVLNGPPQSITKLNHERVAWIKQKLTA